VQTAFADGVSVQDVDAFLSCARDEKREVEKQMFMLILFGCIGGLGVLGVGGAIADEILTRQRQKRYEESIKNRPKGSSYYPFI
jgi:hypothetical protein